MPIGNPIRKQNESRMVSVLATEGQTVFTVQGGYIINHISVFRNGVRLSPAEDFTAGDGSTVTLNNAANIDDRIDFHIFDRFTVQNAIVGAASTQTISGDLVVNGKVFGNLDVPQINVASGIVTTHDLNVTGVSTIATLAGANVSGIVTATELDLNGKGDISGDLNVTGVTTVGKQVHVGTGVSIAAGGLNVTAGISTFQAVQGTTGTFSGVIKIPDGSTSAPSIAASSDTNSGLYFAGADALGLVVGGSRKLLANSSGVTINNGDLTIDDKIIHQADTDTAIRFSADDTIQLETGGAARLTLSGGNIIQQSGTLYIKNATGDSNGLKISQESSDESRIFNHYSGSLTFGTNNTERLRITSDGRLLLGTATANSSDIFTILDPGDAFMSIRSETASDNTNQILDFAVGTANRSSSNLTATIAATIPTGSTAGGTLKGDLKFSTNGGDNLTERARITSAGRLGIGENSPDALLHLSTGASTTCELRLQSNNTGSGAGDRGRISVYSSLNNGTEYQAGYVDIDRSSGTDDQAHLLVALNNGSSVGERVRILSGGGITFNGDTAAANALDDYEEGSWTATVTGTNSNMGSQTGRSFRYTKIGNVVHFTFDFFQTNNNMSVTNISIAGLPFATLPNSFISNISIGTIQSNGGSFQMKNYMDNGANIHIIDMGTISNIRHLSGQGHYFTTS